MSILHSSTRRPSPLKDTDYDHEINLIDHTRADSPEVARSRSAGGSTASPGVISDSSSQRHSDVPLRKHATPLRLRQEITKRKYNKYQDRRLGQSGGPDEGEPDNDTTEELDTVQTARGEAETENRGRARDNGTAKRSKQSPDSAIDILYENQRGGFLCGIPLFSSSALGNLDPSPWTNIANKTSATNITNAQVPDPSWEWAWPEWHINHTDEVDEDGWEYSFMFSKKFSWHGKSWYSSFVRRRAWTRKRVKKSSGYRVDQGHMLNSDYFTIHPAEMRDPSRASTAESQTKRFSTISRREMEEGIVVEQIQDIGTLLKALRLARIDREKTEAVESFIQHGGDDLYHLRDHMHEIMGMFIFQASRRLLLSHLLGIFNKASEENDVAEMDHIDPAKKRRLKNLEAAVKHADEEVRRLEYWSDVKDLAAKGETKGAVDESQGWGEGWSSLDNSAPKDVISDQKLPGAGDCHEQEGNGTTILNKENAKPNGKGKGKAKV